MIIPKKWKLVPIEPTPEQINAMIKIRKANIKRNGHGMWAYRDEYQAAINKSPEYKEIL